MGIIVQATALFFGKRFFFPFNIVIVIVKVGTFTLLGQQMLEGVKHSPRLMVVPELNIFHLSTLDSFKETTLSR